MRYDCENMPCKLPECDCKIDVEFIGEVDIPQLGNLDVERTKQIRKSFVEGLDKDLSYYALPKDSLLERILESLLNVLKGKNITGKVLGRIKDGIGLISVKGALFDRLTDTVGNILFKPKWDKYMAEQESFFKKIKRYIKQPSTQSALALVATVLGSSWIGIDINVELLTQSILGIVTGAAGVYAGLVNIYGMFKDEDKGKA